MADCTIRLSGRIDSNNAAQAEQDILSQIGNSAPSVLTLDAGSLDYISSAGLRIILRLRKAYPGLRITNVGPDIYSILETTGFTEMMTVEKACRVVSVEGCEVIGEGFNGKVYRIDQDNVVKTYKNADALEEIRHEREVARLALILGVPTAISYDIVRVGDSYGSVFELLNASSFAKILATEPERMDWCVHEYVSMLKKIHGITVPAGKLPKVKDKYLKAAERVRHLLPEGLGDKLVQMISAVPDSDKMIHGDYHTKNIVLAGDEVLIIDMDTLSVGHPIFELAQMYNSYVGFSELDPDVVLRFQGYPAAIARKFWKQSLTEYLGTEDDGAVTAVEEKIRCAAYTRLMDWHIRHETSDSAEQAAEFELWKTRLTELLGRTDSLLWDAAGDGVSGSAPRNEMDIEATVDNLPKVSEFVESRLLEVGCPIKAGMQISVAVEEIFVNIAHYAYAPEKGTATVRVEVSGDPVTVTVTFIDHGKPYDPLAKNDPDVTLPADDREIGGLGIFMTKKLMDDVSYQYKDGQNILTLVKKI